MFFNFVVLKVFNLPDTKLTHFSSGINLVSILKEDLCKDFGGFYPHSLLQMFRFLWHTEVFAYSGFYFAFLIEFSEGDTTPIGRPSFSYSGKLF